MKHVIITTDGSCQPNPGPGGWAAILRYGTACREISGRESNTTNNRMELTAILEGLRALKEPCRVTVRTDSKTAIAWTSARAFRRKAQQLKHPKVYPLVLQYREVAKRHEVYVQWVRGHNGDPDNERADQLAQDMCVRPF